MPWTVTGLDFLVGGEISFQALNLHLLEKEMDTAALQSLLLKMKCVRIGGTNYCPCPNHQPDEDDADRFKLMVSPAKRYAVTCFCPVCMIGKPQTDEERRVNRQVARAIWQAVGADLDAVYTPMGEADIRKLWEGVRVGGQVVGEGPERQSDQLLHTCHEHLLSKLTLSDRHRCWLAKKGFDPDWCWERGYRTAESDVEGFCANDGIPGLVRGRWLLRAGSLLTPCRDRRQLIGALKQRVTDGGRARMRLVSGGGVKAKQMAHWPVGSEVEKGLALMVVEGERKADFLFHKWGVNVVAVPGVGSWSLAVEPAVECGWAILALDQDDAGRRYTPILARALAERGVRVQVCQWEGAKGPDDALASGAAMQTVDWVETGRQCNDLTPNQKVQTACPPPKRRLKDHEIVPYLKANGPTLRNDLNAYSLAVESLIRTHKIKMVKTQLGQLLEAAE